MSKVKELKTIEVEGNEVKKITEEQLKSIADKTALQNDFLRGMGILESQKLEIYGRLMEANKEMEEVKKELEEEYGAVNIDLKTGEYTVIEAEEPVMEKA
jgi:hypothetical protein